MSEEQEVDWNQKLNALEHVVKMGWVLITGAFGIGVWVTTIQINQNAHDKQMEAIKERVDGSQNGHERRITILEYTSQAQLEIARKMDSKIDTLTTEIRNKTASK